LRYPCARDFETPAAFVVECCVHIKRNNKRIHMRVGIVGLPQTGKTTLFRALTKGTVNTDSLGAQSGKALVGVVAVPDPRFDWLVEENSPKKVTPATIEFVDGAAKVGGADQKTRFGSDFFADVRNVDALVHVVRVFESDLGEAPTPLADARNFAEELVLADLQMIESKLQRMEKGLRGVKSGAVTPETLERDLLLEIQKSLEEGKMTRSMNLSPEQSKIISSFQFLTLQPMIVVANVTEDKAAEGIGPELAELKDYCESNDMSLLALSAKIEAEIAELPEEEEGEFLESMGLSEPARNVLIRECYRKLGLLCFFTAGEPEVRAWTITAGSPVIEAAGKIHSDIARGFIRAEVGHFEDVKNAGGWEEAKRANLVELHTKEYIVQDGDVMYIRFKV